MSESKPAGMWRPIELTDGDIVKLFQSGEHGEANYRQFDGRWYVLDESPEGIAEARQEEHLSHITESRENCIKTRDWAFIEIDRLTADLAKMKEQRDSAMKLAGSLFHWADYADEYFQEKHGLKDDMEQYEKLRVAHETGGKNVKE